LIKLQVRGYSSRLGRFTLTPIVEAEYMAATGFPTQISDRYLLGWVHIWWSGAEFELPVLLWLLPSGHAMSSRRLFLSGLLSSRARLRFAGANILPHCSANHECDLPLVKPLGYWHTRTRTGQDYLP
jgi:hypothetical protein